MNKICDATINTLRGLGVVAKREVAFRIEVGMFALALIVAPFAAPGISWYVAMIGVFFIVLAAELLNTPIEKLANHVTRKIHPQIGMVKDFGSAAVFCTLCLSGLVWLAALSVRFGVL